MRRIVEECHREADRLLAANRDKLDALAHALLASESLDEAEIHAVTGIAGAPVAEDVASRLRAPAD